MKKKTQTHNNFYNIGNLTLAQDLTLSVSENAWTHVSVFSYMYISPEIQKSFPPCSLFFPRDAATVLFIVVII